VCLCLCLCVSEFFVPAPVVVSILLYVSEYACVLVFLHVEDCGCVCHSL